MTPLAANEINGVWATLLVRVVDGKPTLDGLGQQIEALAAAGVDGVYTHGTAAEFHGQTEAMFRQFCEVAAEHAEMHQLPFQIGAAHPFAFDALARVQFARTLEPSAIQVILPDWAPVDLVAAGRFLDGCIEAADGIGLVLYNPPHAKRVLSPSELTSLLGGRDGIVGLKCAGGDADWYARMQPLLDQISVFIPGHFMASGMARGARGSYSNICCLNPRATVAWRDQIAADPLAAIDLETRIGEFMAAVIAPLIEMGYHGYACDKFLAHLGGWTEMSTELVWPYEAIPVSHVPAARDALATHLPEFAGAAARPAGG